MTVFYAILSITILYFLLALFGGFIKKIVGRKICAICAAVSLTWFSLLILRLLGFGIDILVVAILMGQSVVGLMVKLENYFDQKGLPKFWLVRILIITGGTLFVYWLLKEDYTLLLLLSISSSLFLVFVLSIIPKEVSKKQINSKEFQKATAKLEKLMEDCC